jgi:nucleoid-associated protein EbfC
MNLDLNKLFEQAKNMQEKIKISTEELSSITVQSSSGGGMVKVTANGNLEIMNVEIEDEIVKLSDKEMLEDLVRAACNTAIQDAKKKAEEEMASKTGDLFKNINLDGFGK